MSDKNSHTPHNHLQKISALRQIGLNFALYTHQFSAKINFDYTAVPKHADLSWLSDNTDKLDIHFWVPSHTPGARITVSNVIGHLRTICRDLHLDWHFNISEDLPNESCDIIICYKAVPPPVSLKGSPAKVLMISDQLECFWGSLDTFDMILVHSSRPLAELLSKRHSRVFFIEESEDIEEVASGKKLLASSKPSERQNILVWHGHKHTLEGLLALRGTLEKFARSREATLRIISNMPAAKENWGRLQVEYLPHDETSFDKLVSEAKIGLVPVRNQRPKHCYFKPSSRLRRLYALGVPAIGEEKCQMVKEFTAKLPKYVSCLPAASSEGKWLEILEYYWENPSELDNLAISGNRLVEQEYVTTINAGQWIWFLSELISGKKD